MANVKVNKLFWDRVAKVNRRPGDEFSATNHRARQIAERLPGYVEVAYDEPAVDLASLKNDELIQIAKDKGIELPKRIKKADLVALLKG